MAGLDPPYGMPRNFVEEELPEGLINQGFRDLDNNPPPPPPHNNPPPPHPHDNNVPPILNNNPLFGVNPNNGNGHNRQQGHRFGFIPQGQDPREIKPSLIHLLGQSQFGGALNEDPHAHLAVFEESCGTFAREGEELDNLKLKCFHLSLRDNARTWLRTVNRDNIRRWDDMEKLFLGKYFPPSKTQHF